MPLSESQYDFDNAGDVNPVNPSVRCEIKTPKDCSDEEIRSFIDLVHRGGEADPDYIMHAIYEAKALALYYQNDKLIAVGAVKSPNPGYTRKVFRMSGSTLDPADYEYELGWLYTTPERRGKGAGQKIIGDLLQRSQGKRIYATTREENVPALKIMKKNGFTREGRPYKSYRGNYRLILHVNHPDIRHDVKWSEN